MESELVGVATVNLNKKSRLVIELVSNDALIFSLIISDLYRCDLASTYGIRLDNAVRWLARNNIRLST